jgi:hypothetical protein
MSGVDWWRLNHSRYPGGRGNMARDYLAIPASSVPAERLFSSAVNHLRPSHLQALLTSPVFFSSPPVHLNRGCCHQEP